MSKKGYWIAFAIGVSAGAAVALLYAPQTGVRTRRQLKRSLDDGVEYLEQAADYLKQQAENLTKEAQKTFDRTRGQVDDAVSKARGQVDDVVAKASGAVTGAVKSAQSLM